MVSNIKPLESQVRRQLTWQEFDRTLWLWTLSNPEEFALEASMSLQAQTWHLRPSATEIRHATPLAAAPVAPARPLIARRLWRAPSSAGEDSVGVRPLLGSPCLDIFPLTAPCLWPCKVGEGCLKGARLQSSYVGCLWVTGWMVTIWTHYGQQASCRCKPLRQLL